MVVDRRPRRPVRVLTLICVAYTRIVWLPLVCVFFLFCHMTPGLCRGVRFTILMHDLYQTRTKV